MYSLVIWESLFIPYIFPIGVWFIDDQSMRKKKKKKIKSNQIKSNKKKTKKKKKEKKRKAQWYAHVWYLVPLGIYATFEDHLLGIFVIVGFCEFFMSFSLLEPLLLCIWSAEGLYESSMRSSAVWIVIDIF